MKVLLGAVLLAAIVGTASACGSSHATGSAPTLVSESRLIEHGTVRCTATVRTTPVEVGDALGKNRVKFTFENVSKHEVSLSSGNDEEGSAVVRSPDGTTYDPLWGIEHSVGGAFGPTGDMAPGARMRGKTYLPRVAWEGPLRIIPSCGNATLHPVRVPVTSPGLPASAQAAVRAVAAASRHLLDHCRPRTPGVSVVGRIDPPRGNLPSFRARCSVSLRREHRFYVAQLLVVTPTTLRDVRILPTYEQIREPDVGNRNTQVIAWKFVVTRRGATPVDNAVGQTATRNWQWTRPGDEKFGVPWCGGSGGGSEPDVPEVSFLSPRCHRA